MFYLPRFITKVKRQANIQKANTNNRLVSRLHREFLPVGKRKIDNGEEK